MLLQNSLLKMQFKKYSLKINVSSRYLRVTDMNIGSPLERPWPSSSHYSVASYEADKESGLPCEDEETDIGIDTSYKELQMIHEWIHVSISGRSPHLLHSLHSATLAWGVKLVRERIENLICQDQTLFLEWRLLLSDSEDDRKSKASAYTGWCWLPPAPETLDILTRSELRSLLDSDIQVYDAVVNSVTYWKKQIEMKEDQRRQRWQTRRMIMRTALEPLLALRRSMVTLEEGELL